MIYLPSTSFEYVQIDSLYPTKQPAKKIISTKSFYAFPYEVSNGMYLQYIHSFYDKGVQFFQDLLPDTTVWRAPLAFNEPYVDYYFRHPAYREYPVVGLTHEQCKLYCDWLTLRYNSNEKRKHRKVIFRLPTADEWYRIAISNIDNDQPVKKTEDSKLTELGIYQYFPWDGVKMTNEKGDRLANYRPMHEAELVRDDDTITNANGRQFIRTIYYESWQGYYPGADLGVAGQLNDYADITAPVDSYYPTENGFYNLAGNVEEFVAEYGITKGGSWRDIAYYLRNDVYEKYDSTKEATSTRGFRFVMEVVEEW